MDRQHDGGGMMMTATRDMPFFFFHQRPLGRVLPVPNRRAGRERRHKGSKMSHNNVGPAEIEAMMVMMIVEYDVIDDDVWDAHDDGSDG